MSTIIPALFEINGVIDPGQSVMSNLNTLCTASGCWLTYDVNSGLWSVVINKAGTSIKSFNDSNIIGSINISGTGINEFYNKVTVEFPHVDLRDRTDYVDMVIPIGERFPNEVDNTLNINLDCINNPIQAQYIGAVELKQSRVDKVIEFRTDYSSIGLKAGDLIDVTSEPYGYTNKVFRITKMTEEDQDDGSIQISITALEYDANVYSTDGLIREERNKKTGIIPKAMNTALTESEAKATSTAVVQGMTLDPSFVTQIAGLLQDDGNMGVAILNQVLATSEMATSFNFMVGPPPNPGGTDSQKLAWSFNDYTYFSFVNSYKATFGLAEHYRIVTVNFNVNEMFYDCYQYEEGAVQSIGARDIVPMYVELWVLPDENWSNSEVIYNAGGMYLIDTFYSTTGQSTFTFDIKENNLPIGGYIVAFYPHPIRGVPGYINPILLDTRGYPFAFQRITAEDDKHYMNMTVKAYY